MSAEFPLSTKIRGILYSSILNIITKGLSEGYLIPLASLSKKEIYGLSLLGALEDGKREWMFFTSLM